MSKRAQTPGFKRMIAKLFKDAARDARLQYRRDHHRIGPGRSTIWRGFRRSKDYGVGFCGGAQEIARRFHTGGNHGASGTLPARG